MNKILLIILIICLFTKSYAQNNEIDSLLKVIKFTKNDSLKVKDLLSLSSLYTDKNLDSAIIFAKQAIEISKKNNNKKQLSTAYVELGWAIYMMGNYSEALINYFEALKISESINDKKQISNSLGNIGAVYKTMNDLQKAKDYYFKALKIDEELAVKEWIAIDISNLGIIYMEEGDCSKALEFYFKALKINEEMNNKQEISIKLGNIANVYLKLGEAIENQPKTQDSLYNLALEYYFKALKIDEEIGRKSGIVVKYANIGNLYMNIQKYLKAKEYLLKALELSYSIGILDYTESIHKSLSQIYDSLKIPQKALEHYKLYVLYKDSIFNEEATKNSVRIEMNFEFEKKQAVEKAEQEKKDAIQKAEENKQRLILIFVSLGLMLVAAFSIFIFKMFIQKKKANILLSNQNIEIKQQKEEIQSQRDEIEAQRDMVTFQKEEIEGSIKYAQIIQNAVLPSQQLAKDLFGEYFILFKPKDVVSGDFYWFSKVNNWTLIAVADCTGHGVPGGFMSMLGISFLNEIVARNEVQTASSVLEEMRKYVIQSLQQQSTNEDNFKIDYNSENLNIKDGMDMSFVAIDFNTGKIQFAGANNSLWIVKIESEKVRLGESVTENPLTFSLSQSPTFSSLNETNLLIEVKPDKQPVAIYESMKPFTNHEIQLQKGDIIYLFSDGYSDQFGGPKGKKFKSRVFQNIIKENAQLPMNEQCVKLNSVIENWKNAHSEKHHQTDDITVLGIKYL
ncbi:MAG: hypothetical protein A2046_17215 [Bacteroidetes bacterium GWA2_30_7]|nr:MAG: hypothetical protein A2046_17215 [Bacteroidetes bacterium GWA2_30_7]